jgi:hypothetical protein
MVTIGGVVKMTKIISCRIVASAPLRKGRAALRQAGAWAAEPDLISDVVVNVEPRRAADPVTYSNQLHTAAASGPDRAAGWMLDCYA